MCGLVAASRVHGLLPGPLHRRRHSRAMHQSGYPSADHVPELHVPRAGFHSGRLREGRPGLALCGDDAHRCGELDLSVERGVPRHAEAHRLPGLEGLFGAQLLHVQADELLQHGARTDVRGLLCSASLQWRQGRRVELPEGQHERLPRGGMDHGRARVRAPLWRRQGERRLPEGRRRGVGRLRLRAALGRQRERKLLHRRQVMRSHGALRRLHAALQCASARYVQV
mmetsp:Transcript_51234/g.166059  ORF Transcript_51234/g.166059 Transcript_51234/m.166059 type:complete len:226 (-) Transcript_51234:2257-2934(-)